MSESNQLPNQDLLTDVASELHNILPYTGDQVELQMTWDYEDSPKGRVVVRSGASQQHTVKVPATVPMLMHRMRLGVIASGHPGWRTATVTVQRSGEFDYEFGY